MTLSILICSIEERTTSRAPLLHTLLHGIGRHHSATSGNIQRHEGAQAEIIICTDNKVLSVGAKRNLLISKAKGKYICFVDDDDIVSNAYVSKILEAAKENPDVIVFDVARYEGGKPDRMARYGAEYKRDSNTANCYYRLPNHLMPVLRSIALKEPFKEISFGEDSDYSQRILPHLKTQTRITETLYEYRFDKTKSATAQ